MKLACQEVIAGATSQDVIEERMKDVFRLWDADNSGTISKAELVDVFNQLTTGGLPPAAIDKLFKAADKNHDGAISYLELADWILCAPNLQSYFKESEALMRLNMKEAMSLQMQAAKDSGKDVKSKDRYVAAKKEEAKRWKKIQEKHQQRIDEKLTPIIKQAFAWHDKDGSGCLERNESILFFENYVSLLQGYLLTTAQLTSIQIMEAPSIPSRKSYLAGDVPDAQGQRTSQKPRIEETVVARSGIKSAELARASINHGEGFIFGQVAFERKLMENTFKYNCNRDEHHQKAFKVLDINGDGRLQEAEVIEALLHGHPKNQEFIDALGFLVKFEVEEEDEPDDPIHSREAQLQSLAAAYYGR